jgi:hypothetical protein
MGANPASGRRYSTRARCIGPAHNGAGFTARRRAGHVGAMSSRQVYRFQRGEPIVIGRQVVSGDGAGLTALALLKPASGFTIPAESVEPAATFEVEYRAAAGSSPAHWLFWIQAADASDLALGRYATDVRFMIDGDTVEVTDPAWIIISESVSG